MCEKDFELKADEVTPSSNIVTAEPPVEDDTVDSMANYMGVSRERWNLIPKGAKIKYKRFDDEIHTGYVTNSNLVLAKKNPVIRIQSHLVPATAYARGVAYFKWDLEFEEISEIFVQLTPIEIMMQLQIILMSKRIIELEKKLKRK
jgi:hypothetical protein